MRWSSNMTRATFKLHTKSTAFLKAERFSQQPKETQEFFFKVQIEDSTCKEKLHDNQRKTKATKTAAVPVARSRQLNSRIEWSNQIPAAPRQAAHHKWKPHW
jgi:hypothetical protein